MKKEQDFQNWDSFDKTKWSPSEKETFYYCAPDWNFTGEFSYDSETGCWLGKIVEGITFPYRKDDILADWYRKTYAAVDQCFRRWNLDTDRVNWLFMPYRYNSANTGDYHSALREILDPRPGMYYRTYNDEGNCFVNSKYSVLHEGAGIEVHFNQYIYNENANPITLWNTFIELSKKRVDRPFTVVLESEED